MLTDYAESRLQQLAFASRVLKGEERKEAIALPKVPRRYECVQGHEIPRKVKWCPLEECGARVLLIPPRCRLCGRELPGKRQSWCSEECKESYYIATSSSVLRYHVYLRDRGVCASCNTDCADLERRVYGYDTMTKRPRPKGSVEKPHSVVMEQRDYMATQGFDVRGNKSFWQADHVEAIEEGGSWRLENVQTLCVPCHKEKTAEHAGRRARTKRLVGRKHVKTQRQRRLSR